MGNLANFEIIPDGPCVPRQKTNLNAESATPNICKPNTQKAKVGGFPWIQSQPELHSERQRQVNLGYIVNANTRPTWAT